jgi:hypothetical protein
MHSLSSYLQIFVVISLFYIIHGLGKLWLSRGLILWVANWRDDEDLVLLEAVSFFSVIAVDCDILAGSFASIVLFKLETNFWREIQLLNTSMGLRVTCCGNWDDQEYLSAREGIGRRRWWWQVTFVMRVQKTIASPGRGSLAMDESNATCGLRLASIGLENTEVNRQASRRYPRSWRVCIWSYPFRGDIVPIHNSR